MGSLIYLFPTTFKLFGFQSLTRKGYYNVPHSISSNEEDMLFDIVHTILTPSQPGDICLCVCCTIEMYYFVIQKVHFLITDHNRNTTDVCLFPDTHRGAFK